MAKNFEDLLYLHSPNLMLKWYCNLKKEFKMILVEGPDNSGKSTLIEQLTARFNLFKCERPHGPPKSAEELYFRIKDFQNFYKSKMFIMDRNPVIGESIYGPILRNHNMFEDLDTQDQIEFEAELFSKITTKTIFLIYCRPPLEVITNLETHQVKDYDTEEHLKSLSLNRYKIVQAYDDVMSHWAHYTYNYKDPEALNDLIKTIEKEYINNERERYITRVNPNTHQR